MENINVATKYYIIAGEASGDLHGSNLIKALKSKDPNAIIRAWGGDKMQAAGAFIVKHYRDLAFMGFVEVLFNLKTILSNIKFCKQDIAAFQPDVIILIDYPGFNLRIAKWAKTQGIKVIYYIAPQVWAWKEGRVKMMKKCIDKLLVILPFEKKYFKDKWAWGVDYVGHPLIEEVNNKIAQGTNLIIKNNNHQKVEKPIIALLPGSRKQEIKVKLPIMLGITKHFPNHHFVVAQAPSLDKNFYAPFTNLYPNVSIVQNKTYDLLLQSTAALVTSGTATLETALFGVPEVVCYKGSEISYQIAKRVINIKYISLVNLIMNKEVVKELIQGDMNEKDIVNELNLLLHNPQKQAQIKNDYHQLKTILQVEEDASQKAVEIILKEIS